MAALAEMYVQGVSTRTVKAITEELCGHSFSASAISAINKSLDEALERFASWQLEEAYPYVILDARYEKVREDGVISPARRAHCRLAEAPAPRQPQPKPFCGVLERGVIFLRFKFGDRLGD